MPSHNCVAGPNPLKKEIKEEEKEGGKKGNVSLKKLLRFTAN